MQIEITAELNDKLQQAIYRAREAEGKREEAIKECNTAFAIAEAIWEKVCLEYQRKTGNSFVITPLFSTHGIVPRLNAVAVISIPKEQPDGPIINGLANNTPSKDG